MTDPNGAAIYGVPWIPSTKTPINVSIFLPAPAGSVMGDVVIYILRILMSMRLWPRRLYYMKLHNVTSKKHSIYYIHCLDLSINMYQHPIVSHHPSDKVVFRQSSGEFHVLWLYAMNSLLLDVNKPTSTWLYGPPRRAKYFISIGQWQLINDMGPIWSISVVTYLLNLLYVEILHSRCQVVPGRVN